MSEGDILLNSLSAGLGESEEHIVIGRDRVVIVPESLMKIAVQYDHNIETVTFDCPRYWDDLDLSTMTVYVNYMRSDGYSGSTLAGAPTVDEDDEDVMHFTWTLSSNATQIKGALTFLVCIKAVDEEGREIYHWNSELNSDMYVVEGLECNETILLEYPDIITHLLSRMDLVEGQTYAQTPIIRVNLDNVPSNILKMNTYYMHVGPTNVYTNGVIYFYDGKNLRQIDGIIRTGFNSEDDIIMISKADFEALETKEEGKLYIFTDDTTLEEIDKSIKSLEERMSNLGFKVGDDLVTFTNFSENRTGSFSLIRTGKYALFKLNFGRGSSSGESVIEPIFGGTILIPEGFRPEEMALMLAYYKGVTSLGETVEGSVLTGVSPGGVIHITPQSETVGYGAVTFDRITIYSSYWECATPTDEETE